MLLIQEHKLDAKAAAKAKKMCAGWSITAHFAARDDGAAREGTAVLIKHVNLGIGPNTITFDSTSDGRFTLASFEMQEAKERIGE